MELGNYSLDKYLKNKKIELQDVSYIFWRIFIIILKLHSKNIAHRDIKPLNIMIIENK
jgi:serine/threonine protein kinase